MCYGEPVRIYCARCCPECGTPAKSNDFLWRENQSVEVKSNA